MKSYKYQNCKEMLFTLPGSQHYGPLFRIKFECRVLIFIWKLLYMTNKVCSPTGKGMKLMYSKIITIQISINLVFFYAVNYKHYYKYMLDLSLTGAINIQHNFLLIRNKAWVIVTSLTSKTMWYLELTFWALE